MKTKPTDVFPSWNYDMIQKLDEGTAKIFAGMDRALIKGFNVYFIDFEGYFGYSACVFGQGRHIYFADDFALHHPTIKTRDELREWYINGLSNVLFTEDELREPSRDYTEAFKKEYFLRNYYSMQAKCLSIFGDGSTQEKRDAWKREREAYPYYSDVAFAYFKDKAFVDHMQELYDAIEEAEKKRKDDFEYQKGAFLAEMWNHEYHINTYQGDFDTLSAFGNIKWRGESDHELQDYFEQLHFTEIQKAAYYAARRECLKTASEKGWY